MITRGQFYLQRVPPPEFSLMNEMFTVHTQDKPIVHGDISAVILLSRALPQSFLILDLFSGKHFI
jgi:hypothetical protein